MMKIGLRVEVTIKHEFADACTIVMDCMNLRVCLESRSTRGEPNFKHSGDLS